LNIWRFLNNKWIGLIIGGIIGLILITIFSIYYNLSHDFLNHIVTMNIITLIIIYCNIYFIIFKLLKDSKYIKRIHLILINSLLGAVFGLLVGLMSYEGEIYWFVIGFVIVSIIPVVNMLAVVFWLGATIYSLYYPEILIPIFNDFLPIHLIDGSMKEITSLPLFIFPISVFFGYFIVLSVTKSHEKKILMTSKIAEEKEIKNEINKYDSKLKKWVMEGYDTTILEERQKSSNLAKKIQNLRDFESKIQKLKQLEKEMQQIDMEEFDYDIISIKKKFKNPYKVDEIESDLSSLKIRIKLKIEKLVEKTDYEIKNALNAATKARNLHLLSSLKIFQEDLLKYSKCLRSNEISYKDDLNKIKDLYNKVVTLNVPIEKKFETPPIQQIEKPNYYEIFNIKPDATQEQIKKMFKRLSLAYHPDTEEDTGVNGDQKFRMIIEAYEVLNDPDKRKKYDEEIGILK